MLTKNSSVINRHYISSYMRNPLRKVTVTVVGVGGTGSFLIPKLARLNIALKAFGHLGLYVTVFDDKKVSTSNPVRQLHSPVDIGKDKAEVLISRINRYYGLDWKANNFLFRESPKYSTNVIISCVDNVEARKVIKKAFKDKNIYQGRRDEGQKLYWIDVGNEKDTGQIVISSSDIMQPEEIPDGIMAHAKLFTIFDLFDVKASKNVPSCSVEESLSKQGLYINDLMAIYTAEIFRRLLFDFYIDFNVLFVNLNQLTAKEMWKYKK